MRERIKSIHSALAVPELILTGLWVFFLCLVIAPARLGPALGFMAENPLLLALNILPVVVVLLTVYFLTENVFLSGAAAELLFGLMNYANLLKIEGRDDPFVPGDLALLREALQATGEYGLDMHWPLLLLLGLSAAALVSLGLWLGRSKGLGWPRRAAGALLTAALLAGACATVYDDEDIYGSFPVSSRYNITTVFNELGFNYCFLYNLGLYTAERPAGYSAARAEAYMDGFVPAAAPAGERPHILMVMCEAFSDLCGEAVFDYPAQEHPLRDYYAVLDGGNCFSGYIVAPDFGAGTANTEFDVLTGMQTDLISQTSNSALRSFFKNIPALPRTLQAAGYDSVYMHPGQSWFYNRDSAMSRMGFGEKLFIDQLPQQAWSDAGFLEVLTDRLSSQAGEGRLFTYATTIQNHQAYTYDKYDFAVPAVQVRTALSDRAQELLSVYAYGVRCSSEMLLGLTEHLQEQTEPYILVFFGDHRPNLGPDYLAYRELGLDIGGDSPAQRVETCSVPYVVWANDAWLAGRTMEQVSAGLDLPADGRISACFLGEIALEMSGLEGTDPYFSFLGQLRRVLPVIKDGVVAGAEGQLTDSLAAWQQALVDKLHCWQYYRMTDQRVG